MIKISAQNCNLGQTINLIEVKIKVISKSDLGQDLVGIDFDHSNLLDHQNTLETLIYLVFNQNFIVVITALNRVIALLSPSKVGVTLCRTTVVKKLQMEIYCHRSSSNLSPIATPAHTSNLASSRERVSSTKQHSIIWFVGRNNSIIVRI